MSTVETGTVEYAEAGVNFLRAFSDEWVREDLTSVTATEYDVTIQYGSDEAAHLTAEALGIEVRGTYDELDGYESVVRVGSVNGIKVRIVSCWGPS